MKRNEWKKERKSEGEWFSFLLEISLLKIAKDKNRSKKMIMMMSDEEVVPVEQTEQALDSERYRMVGRKKGASDPNETGKADDFDVHSHDVIVWQSKSVEKSTDDETDVGRWRLLGRRMSDRGDPFTTKQTTLPATCAHATIRVIQIMYDEWMSDRMNEGRHSTRMIRQKWTKKIKGTMQKKNNNHKSLKEKKIVCCR